MKHPRRVSFRILNYIDHYKNIQVWDFFPNEERIARGNRMPAPGLQIPNL
jgi:hypothetical protein